MRGQLAFDRTLPYLPLWPSFFVQAAIWLLLVAGVGSTPHTVAAQPAIPDPTWAIEISPQSLCAGDPELEQRLWAQIPERQRAPLASAELRARVSVARDQSATVAVYDQQTQREAGQRRITLSQSGCRAAGEALALVVAVLVEAGRMALAAAPEPEPAPVPPVPPPAPPPTPEATTPSRYKRPERHPWQGPPIGHDLTLLVGTGYGLLPNWALGAQFGWGIRGHHVWPIWISATGWLNEVSENGRGELGAAYATLATCPLHWEGVPVRLRLCPGIAFGAIWGEGRNLPEYWSEVTLLTMASLTGAVHVRLYGPLELIADIRMEVPLPALGFVYFPSGGGTEEIHMTRPVTGTFFGGLGLRFR